MNNKYILPEIDEAYKEVLKLDDKLYQKYLYLSNIIIKRGNVLLERIKSKIPKIIRIPLYYTYFGNNYDTSYNYTEGITEFEDYALDNGHLTKKDIDLIREELLELYYMADTLTYYANLDDDNNTYEIVYHCLEGSNYFKQIETLADCFDE